MPERLAEKIRATRSRVEGERKQMTVMFVDVVRSMDLAERLDPERWRALMDRLFVIVSAAAAVEATGARAELPLIEHVRERAGSVAADTTGV